MHLFPRLKERFSQRGGTMSGGEQQMLAIGRALMSKPKLLLLDEPSLGLAPIIIQQIFDIIEQLRKDGVTVFLVEQNANQALKIADRAYVLENGRVVMQGTGEATADGPEGAGGVPGRLMPPGDKKRPSGRFFCHSYLEPIMRNGHLRGCSPKGIIHGYQKRLTTVYSTSYTELGAFCTTPSQDKNVQRSSRPLRPTHHQRRDIG